MDRQLAPKIGLVIHTEYANNFESYAYKEEIVARAAKGVESRLNDAGLPTTHDVFATCLPRMRFLSHRAYVGRVGARDLAPPFGIAGVCATRLRIRAPARNPRRAFHLPGIAMT